MSFTRKGLFGPTVTLCGVDALRATHSVQMDGYIECDRVLVLRGDTVTGAPCGPFQVDVAAMEQAAADFRTTLQAQLDALEQTESDAWSEYDQAQSLEQAEAACHRAHKAQREAVFVRARLAN
jgi:hypothetical protein